MTWWYLETDRVDDECLKTAVQARYSWRSTRVSHRSQLPTGNRLMDSVLAFWSYTETGAIYCFERSGRCLPLLFNPIQHAPGFVEVYGWVPVPVACRSNKHSSQNSEQGKAECCCLFSGGVLLESHLADSYLFRCCFFYTRLWSTVTKETKHKICIAEHALSHIIIVNSTRACSKPRTNDGPDYS